MLTLYETDYLLANVKKINSNKIIRNVYYESETDSDTDDYYNNTEYKTRNNSEILNLAFPLPNDERLTMYISGKNGCGKTTYITKILDNYTKVYKKRDILLFSDQEYDNKLDGKYNISRQDLTEDIKDITLNHLRNSLCIFDDIDSISNKKIREGIYNLIHNILKNGRSHSDNKKDDIDIIITNHIPNEGFKTKTFIHECNYYVVFRRGSTNAALNTICQKYAGLTNEEFNKVKKTKSRSVLIHNSFPYYMMDDYTITLINLND
jgi:hypothetical protein